MRGATEKAPLVVAQDAGDRIVIVPAANKFGWIKGVLVRRSSCAFGHLGRTL
jgi:hypothetical protein